MQYNPGEFVGPSRVVGHLSNTRIGRMHLLLHCDTYRLEALAVMQTLDPAETRRVLDGISNLMTYRDARIASVTPSIGRENTVHFRVEFAVGASIDDVLEALAPRTRRQKSGQWGTLLKRCKFLIAEVLTVNCWKPLGEIMPSLVWHKTTSVRERHIRSSNAQR